MRGGEALVVRGDYKKVEDFPRKTIATPQRATPDVSAVPG
jgi:hypothetical protein